MKPISISKRVSLVAEPHKQDAFLVKLELLGYEVTRCFSSFADYRALVESRDKQKDEVEKESVDITIVVGDVLNGKDIPYLLNHTKQCPVAVCLPKEKKQLVHDLAGFAFNAMMVTEACEDCVDASIEMACGRFKELYSHQQELAYLSGKLEQRKLLDKTKGVLMQRYEMNENEAYRFIQKNAMDNGASMTAVCEQLLLELNKAS